MQAQLLDSLFGTERGMSASSEVRAEINELITQLEAKSPNLDMTEVFSRHTSPTALQITRPSFLGSVAAFLSARHYMTLAPDTHCVVAQQS